MKRSGRVVLATGLATSGISCGSSIRFNKSLEETLRSDHYLELTRGWDSVFGPPIRWSSKYGGRANFDGHIHGQATPGIDYDVDIGTPLVPMKASYLRQATKDAHGSLYILLINQFYPSYRISFGHLEKIFADEKYHFKGNITKAVEEGVQPLRREDIVALSGNSGTGLIGNRFLQPPHLHITLYYLNYENRTLAYLDPEKFGLDGGRPVFWDGETDLDIEKEKRISRLELTLENLEKETELWPKMSDFDQLEGSVIEYSRLLTGTKGKKILDSKYFHDLRALLKKITLEEKRFIPGTRPYSLMLKMVGYSMDESQEVILTLPFIAPGLTNFYKKVA
ncbi:MAG: hypothetical protein FJ107_07260 [Deltaproteobacteria bacterium]|nr:hypothetical protein [Deltaproteobacteria bacterium]